jgi:hypothetical protein
MAVRQISPFDQWVLDTAGQVVGIQLTDSNVVTNLPDGNPVEQLVFQLNPATSISIGDLQWSAEEETLDLGLADLAIMHIGQHSLYHVENNTGSTIPKGALCQFAGTSGNSGKLRVALWDGTQPSFTLMGIALTAIPDNGDSGYVVHFGKVRGMQTNGANYGETWVDGDVLYAGTSGGLTKVLPAAPSSKTVVAAVVSAHGSNGTLFVRPQIGSSLANDELVQLSTLTGRDGIQYNASTSRFENGPIVITAPASITPALNRDVSFQLTSNTSLAIKVKGTDGVVRSATLTLA